MSELTLESLRHLTIIELLGLLRGRLVVPREQQRPKEHLIRWVLSHADDALRSVLVTAVEQARENTEARNVMRKRKHQAQQDHRRQARRTDDDEADVADNTIDANRYLDLPTDEEKKRCYREYRDATSNQALHEAVCAVCGRRRNTIENAMEVFALTDLPHLERLRPVHFHPAQSLFNGALLEPSGVAAGTGTDNVHVNICNDCLTALAVNKPTPPPLSLANDLWVGPVPWELERLTLPEKQLIALVFPRVYVFKLFPKGQAPHNVSLDDTEQSSAGLQRAMAGSVCTYELDVKQVADMVEGRLMPRPPRVLSSVIAVTFIGHGDLPKSWLHHIFRVRREVVREALIWLKIYNPKYYGDIVINEQALLDLPADDIPIEILAAIRQSSDAELVNEETMAYVPTEDVSAATGEQLTIRGKIELISHCT